jgi:hypothetical protein
MPRRAQKKVAVLFLILRRSLLSPEHTQHAEEKNKPNDEADCVPSLPTVFPHSEQTCRQSRGKKQAPHSGHLATLNRVEAHAAKRTTFRSSNSTNSSTLLSERPETCILESRSACEHAGDIAVADVIEAIGLAQESRRRIDGLALPFSPPTVRTGLGESPRSRRPISRGHISGPSCWLSLSARIIVRI